MKRFIMFAAIALSVMVNDADARGRFFRRHRRGCAAACHVVRNMAATIGGCVGGVCHVR